MRTSDVDFVRIPHKKAYGRRPSERRTPLDQNLKNAPLGDQVSEIFEVVLVPRPCYIQHDDFDERF